MGAGVAKVSIGTPLFPNTKCESQKSWGSPHTPRSELMSASESRPTSRRSKRLSIAFLGRAASMHGSCADEDAPQPAAAAAVMRCAPLRNHEIQGLTLSIERPDTHASMMPIIDVPIIDVPLLSPTDDAGSEFAAAVKAQNSTRFGTDPTSSTRRARAMSPPLRRDSNRFNLSHGDVFHSSSGHHQMFFGSSCTSTSRARKAYVGEEVELGSDQNLLDDFALASSHTCYYNQNSARTLPNTRENDGLDRSADNSTVITRSPLMKIKVPPSETRVQALPKGLEIMEFISLRRSGHRCCTMCLSELPYAANFCPQCGTSTIAPPAPPESMFAAEDSGDMFGASYACSPVGAAGAGSFNPPSSAHSSPLDRPSEPNNISVSILPAQPPRTPTPAGKRKAYRRRVKVDKREEGVLGTGAKGIVYRAMDIRSGQQLAVKQLVLNHADVDELRTVRRELWHLSLLRHPNIVEYLGCRVERPLTDTAQFFEGTPLSTMGKQSIGGDMDSVSSSTEEDDTLRVLILMERMECGSLEDLMKRSFPNGMPEEAARQYVSQLVEALSYVHGCGITHRDIKPANLLMASDGTVKISDFGCASVGTNRSLGSGEEDILGSMDGSKQVAGTPAYMPPEALECIANKDHVDWTFHGKAQDVWAVGCVTHKLLTGCTPWQEAEVSNPFALLLYIQGKTFSISDKLSSNARDFCELCFETDPERRVANAERLIDHPFLAGTALE